MPVHPARQNVQASSADKINVIQGLRAGIHGRPWHHKNSGLRTHMKVVQRSRILPTKNVIICLIFVLYEGRIEPMK